MNYDVVVVGGGPAGCAAAGLISKEGYKTLVVEEHQKIGEPVQCAGLVSPRTLEKAAVGEDVVINKIHGAFIHSPGGEVLSVRSQDAYALVIDRPAFDRKLAKAAQNAGADVLTGTRAALGDYLPEKVTVGLTARGKRTTACARLLIGADGSNSLVARRIAAAGSRDLIRMYAAEVELECPETDMVHIFLGKKIAPGWFGWIIPVDRKNARVGVGVSGRERHPRFYFNKMVESQPGLFKGMSRVRGTGGIVPVGRLARIYGERAMLVGDAACQTKPISGGGLYLGLLGAELCAGVAVKALSKGDVSAKCLSEYQSLWEKEMAGEIRAALSYRSVFLTMSDKEMDRLVRFFNHPLWQHIISKYGDIDYPSWLGSRLSFAGPWAEKFIVAGFKKILNYCSAVQA